ncbi:hypothetical protein Tco_0862963 [Tanacetum coccineum]
MSWTTSNTRFDSINFMAAQELSPTDSMMQDDSIPDEQNNWASTLVSTYETPAENSLLAKTGDMMTFMKWYFRQVKNTTLTQVDFEGHAYEVIKAFYPYVIHLQFQMEEYHKMFTDQIDWTNPEGDQVRVDVNQPLPFSIPPGHGSNPALSISKMNAASYPDFGLELLVLEQMWIDDNYLSKLSSERADFQEHTIAEKDFKNLYPSDFEDLNLLLLQGHLDHLPGSDKRMLSTAVKLWTRNLVIRQRVEDFQLDIESYQTHILEALITESRKFKVKAAQSGMKYAILDKKKELNKSKEFIAAIERRLKTRRIYMNLECFVGGRVRDIDYRLLQRTE